MKKFVLFFVMLLTSVMMFAQSTEPSIEPDFLSGFMSFTGIVTVIVPLIVGFLASKLHRPMNRWVTYWVTGLIGIAVTFFSWWANLGFPPQDASTWVVLIDALFVGLASTGIISVATSEWLAKLLGKKISN